MGYQKCSLSTINEFLYNSFGTTSVHRLIIPLLEEFCCVNLQREKEVI